MEPFVGQIKMFGGNFAPRGWAFCDGQLLAVSSNDALFSLLGTMYGGDGRTTFGLPDLRGRIPVHQTTGYSMGAKGGSETAVTSTAHLPAHSHASVADPAAGTSADPVGHHWANSAGAVAYSSELSGDLMAPGAMRSTGGSQSHNNMQPYQCVSFIIALTGIYPSRS